MGTTDQSESTGSYPNYLSKESEFLTKKLTTPIGTQARIQWTLFSVQSALQPLREKKKQSHYRPGQVLRVPGGRSSQISTQSALEGSQVVSPTHRPPLPARKCSWYSFVSG
jgi:hypothetical protein